MVGLVSVLMTLWFATDAALACACCTNRGGRYVAVETLSPHRLDMMEQMTFADEAFVAQGAADHPIDLKDFGPTLQLAVRRTKTEIVFAFRDEADRTSDVAFAVPDTISIFEVDPRGPEPDAGLGPAFYKEWQLSGAATATGVLRPLIEGGDPKVTLIVHGRGRGCTEASEFTEWTLMIDGPAGRLTLYGALTSAAR
ncbi:hypothetical protein RSO01_38640 [Reyranella soli]|uniref:Lipoprotein n=1 Tax=Reyranella soli TaxID=1230389 RepID=A0A512NCL4_9HYPH|nr:hypothetical protein RSO01_38640 [Reyranella soli]